MGRPPSNGGPSFRFNPKEVAEMENILQAHRLQVPERDIVQSLADKFSHSADREGKVVIQYKQVWNWFQNRRYAIRAKTSRVPGKLNVTPMQRDLATVRNVAQAPPHLPVPPVSSMNNAPQVPQPVPAYSGQNAVKNSADNSQMEFEAKSSRDGAWYDVASFLSHRIENGGPAVLVRFAGFGPEEDEWVHVQKNVRQRSLPCEASECVAVLPNDLILCFQEGREQALYYDAHVLDAQRRRHDARGCRCRFLVRYDHDQSEEIVALRKVCRRPETDYRLQLLHADLGNLAQNKSGSAPHLVNPVPVYPVADSAEKKADIPAEIKSNQPTTGVRTSTGTAVALVSLANAAVNSSSMPMKHSNALLAPGSVGSVGSSVSVVAKIVDVADTAAKHPTRGEDANTTITAPVSLANAPAISVVPMTHSNAPLAPASADADSSVTMDADAVNMADTRAKQPATEVPLNSGTLIDPASLANAPSNISAVPMNPSASSLTPAAAGASDSSVSIVTNPVPVDDGTTKQQPMGVNANVPVKISAVPVNDSNLPVVPTPAGAVDSSVPISAVPVDDSNALASASAGAVDPVVSIFAVPMNDSNASMDSTSAGAVDPSVPISALPMVDSNAHDSSAPTGAVDSSVSISAVPTDDSNAPTGAASPGATDSSVSISVEPIDDSKDPTGSVSASAIDSSLSLSEAPVCDSNALMDPASAGAVDSSLFLSEASVCDSNARMGPASADAVDSSVSVFVVPMNDSNAPIASTPAGPVDSSVSSIAPVAESDCSGTCTVASTTSIPPVVSESTALEENIPGPTAANNEVTNLAEAASIGEPSGDDIRNVAGESGESMQIDQL